MQFDPVVQRFLSMRQDYWYQFKPTPKNFAFFFGVVILPCILIYAKVTHDTVSIEYLSKVTKKSKAK